MSTKLMIRIAAFLGALAVVLGAFGAHGLKALLEPEQLETFKTGILYHFIHTLAMLGIVVLFNYHPSKVIQQSFVLFFAGILLFSCSLYLLSCKDILGVQHWTFLGPITPIGGLCFILAWLNLMRFKK